MKRQTAVVFLAMTLGLIATPAPAGIWTNWQWLNPRPQGHTLRGIAASDSVVVAVGDGGTILISENGTEWDITYSDGTLDLHDIIWTGNQFVTVGSGDYSKSQPVEGDGIILTSPDGRMWVERFGTHSISYFSSVIFNGNQILAIGVKGMTATSPDGLIWIEHAIEEPFNSGMVDVAWNGSTYVALGGPNYFGGMAAIYFSEDGASWTMASLEGLPQMSFDSVVWGHGRFLAFTGWYVLSSLDGISWVLESRNTGVSVQEVIATPGGYLGVGGAKFLESPDGLNWNASDVFSEPRGIYDLVQYQGKLIIVGADGAITVSADQGLQWEALTTWEIASVSISNLCWGDDVLIATVMGTVFRSINKINWQLVTSFGSVIFSVRQLNDAFWVVGSQGLITTSNDGIVWGTRNSESGVDYTDIATNGEVMVAVGAGVLGALVATSTDGYAWNAVEIDDGIDLRIASVTWTGTRFVAVGSQGSIFRSDDGYQWEIDALDLSGYSRSHVVSNGSILVAVGWSDFLVSNDDGLTWRPTLVDQHATDLIWTGEFFIAVGGSSVFFSRNGEDWVVSPVGYSAGTSAVEFNDGELIVAGSGGNLVRAELYKTVPPVECPQDLAPD